MIDIEKMNALYDVIERAIEQCGGADSFLKEYKESTESVVIAFKKHNKKMHKLLLRWLRIKKRIEKGLSVHGKGGALLIAAKAN